MQNIAANKKANHDYIINSKIEAGLVLTGAEVKSLRMNTSSIKESFNQEKKGELWLINCYIKKYSSSIDLNNNPKREKKLLLNRKELNKVIGTVKRDGMTVIPLNLYFNDKGLAKITIGIGKGKKKHDKRATIRDKEWGIKKQRLLKKNSI